MIYDEIAMNNGVIYLYAVDILYNQMNQGVKNHLKKTNEKSNLDLSLFVPVVVNGVFACELFMKSMIKDYKYVHKFDQLFDLLDSDVKKRIRTLTVDKMKNINSTYNENDFNEDLKANNNVYTDWRFFHQRKNISANLNFIYNLLKSIYIIIEEERKEV